MAATHRAAFQLDNDDTWFFLEHRYIHIKLSSDTAGYGPIDLPGSWESFGGWTNVDSFLRVGPAPDGEVHAFVFRGTNAIKISVSKTEPWRDQRTVNSFVIADKWAALTNGHFPRVDAAFFTGNFEAAHNTTSGKAWFFSGNNCALVQFKDDTASSIVEPRPIINTWAALKKAHLDTDEAHFNTVDCVLETDNRHQHWFFSGPKAVLIHTGKDEVIDGPTDVAAKFPALRTGSFY